MAHDLSPQAVAARLRELRLIWTPESAQSVRSRFASGVERPTTFEEAVSLRLAELRALLELTAYLHRATKTAP
jgi:hypothetical protein